MKQVNTFIKTFSCCEMWFQRYLTVCSINCKPKCLTTVENCSAAAKYKPAWAQRGDVSLNRSQAVYASCRATCEALGLIVNSTALASSSANNVTSEPDISYQIVFNFSIAASKN